MSASLQTAKPKRRPFRLRAPVVPEVDLQASVADALDLLLLPPAQWCAMPVGHIKLTGQQAARMTRIGTRPSWPDLLVVHDGAVFGIELKRVGGLLSATRQTRTRSGAVRLVIGQREQFERLGAAGMRIAVCRSVEDTLVALRGWNIPLRGVS